MHHLVDLVGGLVQAQEAPHHADEADGGMSLHEDDAAEHAHDHGPPQHGRFLDEAARVGSRAARVRNRVHEARRARYRHEASQQIRQRVGDGVGDQQAAHPQKRQEQQRDHRHLRAAAAGFDGFEGAVLGHKGLLASLSKVVSW